MGLALHGQRLCIESVLSGDVEKTISLAAVDVKHLADMSPLSPRHDLPYEFTLFMQASGEIDCALLVQSGFRDLQQRSNPCGRCPKSLEHFMVAAAKPWTPFP